MNTSLDRGKADYSIFSFFKQNVSVLRENRPDLYLIPGEGNYQFGGTLTSTLSRGDLKDDLSRIMARVQAANCSIVLNSTSYFEGLLENLLLRRIGKCKDLSDHLRALIDNYRSQITKISSLSEFKKHFRMLFGARIADFVKDAAEDLVFVDRFYVIRHTLAHGSRLPTLLIDAKRGGALVQHEDRAYGELMRYLQKRYHLSGDFHCDIIMFLMFSIIVDDFSRAVFGVGEMLVHTLLEAELISADTFWGDFSSSHTYYGKL